MAFPAPPVCQRELGGGLSPLHRDGNSGSETALGHTRSAPRLLTATPELRLCLEHLPPLSVAARNWACGS